MQLLVLADLVGSVPPSSLHCFNAATTICVLAQYLVALPCAMYAMEGGIAAAPRAPIWQ